MSMENNKLQADCFPLNCGFPYMFSCYSLEAMLDWFSL